MNVLVLEDDPLLQLDIKDMLEDAGYGVTGPFRSISSAMEACDREMPDLAVLDFNLGDGQTSAGLADMLLAKGIKFVFVTGYSRRYIPDRFGQIDILEKPIQPHALLHLLK